MDFKDSTMGFICSHDLLNVYLIRKTHPEWLAESLNGVGGHRKITETFSACMKREAYEEAGYTGTFTQFATLYGTNRQCLVYYSIMQEGQRALETCEKEKIEPIRLNNILADAGQMNVHLPWLILAAVSHVSRPDDKFRIDVKYMRVAKSQNIC
ncbi:MAG: NUDIX domain-containing protein [Clostridiales bacterium]|jgi:8-oxo-dGTP pyrophosphatase MutT (NUDIX family)|nr:NUDIX domain-containing protein [Clostridiales bacterium]